MCQSYLVLSFIISAASFVWGRTHRECIRENAGTIPNIFTGSTSGTVLIISTSWGTGLPAHYVHAALSSRAVGGTLAGARNVAPFVWATGSAGGGPAYRIHAAFTRATFWNAVTHPCHEVALMVVVTYTARERTAHGFHAALACPTVGNTLANPLSGTTFVRFARTTGENPAHRVQAALLDTTVGIAFAHPGGIASLIRSTFAA